MSLIISKTKYPIKGNQIVFIYLIKTVSVYREVNIKQEYR